MAADGPLVIAACAAPILAGAAATAQPRARWLGPFVCAAGLAAGPACGVDAQTGGLDISRSTRLMVVAPHPDDETLGAGGVMHRVRGAGGALRVVYLTNGDGYPEGVKAEDHVSVPTPADYRGYGVRRASEARAALDALELGRYTYAFLGFPDGGLCHLMSNYWSDHAIAYRSPFTRLDRPPRGDIVVPATEYHGEDLTQELARIIDDFRPTMIVVPRREDQHPDHCASWFFVTDALSAVERVRTAIHPQIFTYIIHWDDWPFEDVSGALPTPPGLSGGVGGWIRLPLTPQEVVLKQAALTKYQTQMDVMSWFLNAFARSNEILSRPAPPRVRLPVRRSPCCH